MKKKEEVVIKRFRVKKEHILKLLKFVKAKEVEKNEKIKNE